MVTRARVSETDSQGQSHQKEYHFSQRNGQATLDDRDLWPEDILEAEARPRGPFDTYNASDILDEENLELYNGWPVFQPLTDMRERRIAGTIQEILSIAVRFAGFGQAYPDMVECKLKTGNTIKPDVCVVSVERAVNRVKEEGPNNRLLLQGGPELAIELRSPSNSRAGEREKRRQYFENDTLVIWDIDPERGKVWVYEQERPGISIGPLEVDDLISCEQILPGWRRVVGDLFRENLSAEGIAGEAVGVWREQGREQGLVEGEAQGIVKGREQGLAEGIVQGREQGLAEGETRGREQGLTEGIARGISEGIAKGREEGIAEGQRAALRQVLILQAQVKYGAELGATFASSAELDSRLSGYSLEQLTGLIVSIATSPTLANWLNSFPA